MKRLLVAPAAVLFSILTVQAEVGDSLISPDGKWIVFVVKGSGPSVSSGAGDYESSELWQTDLHGGNRTLLASTHNDDLRMRLAKILPTKIKSVLRYQSAMKA